jgi:carboxypeptidase Q
MTLSKSRASRVGGLIGIVVAGACAGSQASAADDIPPAVAQLQHAALADDRAFSTLQSLTTEVGARFAGSPGDAKAVAWALRTLQQQGFSRVRAEPVIVPHWVRGEGSVHLLGPTPVELTSLALGGSIGTADAPVEAEMIAVTDIDELQRLSRADVAGKIVFYYDRMQETRDGMDYGPTARNRSHGAIAAAKLGAVGVVIRAVGSEDADRPHTGAMRYANGVPRIPAFAIGHHGADRLLDAYAEGPVRLRLASNSRCEGPAASANVIGEVPGRGLGAGVPEEFVVLGAHLDSWDVGTGAQDDGAGVATVIEAARRVGEMPQRPQRTLRVVLYANEEFGLSGGRQYALDHGAIASRHHAALEADAGSGRVYQFESRVGPRDVPTAMRTAHLLRPLGVRFHGNVAGGGADIGPLRELGVPVFELQHDASKYFEIHHTDADRIDRVDPRALAFNVAAYATVAWALADGADLAQAERSGPAPQETVHPCEWKPVQ